MISINTNSSSSLASNNLQRASDLLQKSLSRLSSGSRISLPQDDAGGLAVSMKLSSAVKRSQSAATSVANALSLLQVQAGSLKSAASVLDRLSELATLGSDVTKSSTDIANYCTEFNALVSELNVLTSDKFNGISLFCGSATGSLTVYLAQDGSQSMAISQGTLQNSYSSATNFSSVTAAGISEITSAVQNIATLMAQNGAEGSRLQFALDSLNVNEVNLEAANSRIYDVDVAAETSKLARANILVQAGAAMLTQANASQSIALKLLQ
ncbi:MAG: flagellin [Verrucomicrobiota bacterium]